MAITLSQAACAGPASLPVRRGRGAPESSDAHCRHHCRSNPCCCPGFQESVPHVPHVAYARCTGTQPARDHRRHRCGEFSVRSNQLRSSVESSLPPPAYRRPCEHDLVVVDVAGIGDVVQPEDHVLGQHMAPLEPAHGHFQAEAAMEAVVPESCGNRTSTIRVGRKVFQPQLRVGIR